MAIAFLVVVAVVVVAVVAVGWVVLVPFEESGRFVE